MPFPDTVNYPLAYDDSSTLIGDPANQQAFTLAGDLDASASVVSVNEDISEVVVPAFLSFATGELVYAESKNDSTRRFEDVTRAEIPQAHNAGEGVFACIAAQHFTQLKKAIQAIQSAAGINPHGSFGTAHARLSDIATRLSSAENHPYTQQVLASPGLVQLYAGSVAPNGWLLCEGGLVSRATYADLFNVIGENFGAGDGLTTFALPDFRGRLAANDQNRFFGWKYGQERNTAFLPSHQHGYVTYTVPANLGLAAGSYQYTNNGGVTVQTAAAGAGASPLHNNMQPFLVLKYIIRT